MLTPKEYGLGTQSDCFARCPETSFEVTKGSIVYKTKSRSDYWFGNYMVSSRPVTLKTLPTVRNEWLQNFANDKGILWQIVEWEIPYNGLMPEVSNVAKAFKAQVDIRMVRLARRANFQFQKSNFESATGVELIKVESESQYKSALMIALADHEAAPDAGTTADFIEWRFDQRRQSVSLGNGNWWLLMHQGVPVATCGLFFSQDGSKARFREVTTHPKWRKRGFATILCGLLAQNCFEQSQVEELIIVSEPDTTADKIYSRLGFKAVSCQIALIADPTFSQLD